MVDLCVVLYDNLSKDMEFIVFLKQIFPTKMALTRIRFAANCFVMVNSGAM